MTRALDLGSQNHFSHNLIFECSMTPRMGKNMKLYDFTCIYAGLNTLLCWFKYPIP